MAEQLHFDLTARPALGRDAFFVSEANAVAVAMVDAWRDWAARKLLLSGPRGSGKTHLAHIWAAESGAQIVHASMLGSANVVKLAAGPVCIEDVHDVAGDRHLETQAFHLHNLVLAQGHPLLLTAEGAPGQWGLTLPDLASRLQGTPLALILPPDEPLLAALFNKLFEDRQISPPPDVTPYLARHAPRDFHAAQRLVDELDHISLTQGRRLSRDLARRALDALRAPDPSHSSP